jgi:hypothetical protein
MRLFITLFTLDRFTNRGMIGEQYEEIIMGTDIHITLEKRNLSGNWECIPSDIDFGRNYAIFGWLADVRNYSGVPVLADTHEGTPDDASIDSVRFHEFNHNVRWTVVEAIGDFNYDQSVEDRRVTKQIADGVWDGGCTAETGGGIITTYRDLFGEWYFKGLEEIKMLGAERVIFSFDS